MMNCSNCSAGLIHRKLRDLGFTWLAETRRKCNLVICTAFNLALTGWAHQKCCHDYLRGFKNRIRNYIFSYRLFLIKNHIENSRQRHQRSILRGRLERLFFPTLELFLRKANEINIKFYLLWAEKIRKFQPSKKKGHLRRLCTASNPVLFESVKSMENWPKLAFLF